MDMSKYVAWAKKVDEDLMHLTVALSAFVTTLSGAIAVVQQNSTMLSAINPKIPIYIATASTAVLALSVGLSHLQQIEEKIDADLPTNSATPIIPPTNTPQTK
jgi:hypothetical protein